jgi:hypothetical protein
VRNDHFIRWIGGAVVAGIWSARSTGPWGTYKLMTRA